jgi:hypothetical protein
MGVEHSEISSIDQMPFPNLQMYANNVLGFHLFHLSKKAKRESFLAKKSEGELGLSFSLKHPLPVC